jgi:hypothetical protein
VDTSLFWECGRIALFNRRSILDHSLARWQVGAAMCLDSRAVLNRYVLCPNCKEDYLFTLRGIADNPELRCHGCGVSIRRYDRTDEPLLRDVRNTLNEIDSVQLFFSSPRPQPRPLIGERLRGLSPLDTAEPNMSLRSPGGVKACKQLLKCFAMAPPGLDPVSSKAQQAFALAIHNSIASAVWFAWAVNLLAVRLGKTGPNRRCGFGRKSRQGCHC